GRVPVWVGGVLPARRPLRRAARWQGAVPIAYADGQLVRPGPDQLAAAGETIAAERGSLDDFDLVVWDRVAAGPTAAAALRAEIPAHQRLGVTWWIESPVPGRDRDWMALLRDRVATGV
ncbi:MAG: hypothetical protein QM633_12120, partial [Propionicimonas sp.]